MNQNITKIKVETLFASACILGESPVWHEARESCIWVDIEGRRIYEYHWLTKKINSYQLMQRVSLVVPGIGNELILGVQGGIRRFDLSSKSLSWITNLGENWETHRCNDGGCDSKGRLWIGTMELTHKKGGGTVYCVDTNGLVTKKIEGVSISNGIVWSNDNKRLYYIDSPTRKVNCYSYEVSSGNIRFEETSIQIPEKVGMPDGMAIDEQGMLWIALWGGFGVGRFDTDSGEMIGLIDVPAPQVTSCAFVGEELGQLMITTARENMGAEQRNKFPQSGNVFIARPGVRGVTGFKCAL